ncbi:MAG: hypothetical protein LBP85_03315 [Prevotellaceae bacterium]|nr:hypothetical protein [Prevotellaceae bacterium]
MKTILTILMLCGVCCGNAQKNDVENDGLKGNVKTVKYDVYQASVTAAGVVPGEKTEDTKSHYWRSYDRNGNSLHSVYYRKDGTKYSEYIYGNGKLIRYNMYNDYEEIYEYIQYEYNSRGKPVLESTYENGDEDEFRTGFYGNKQTANTIYGHLDRTCEYTYDANDRVIKKMYKSYDYKNELSFQSLAEYTYDSAGKMTGKYERRAFNKHSNGVEERCTYTYDAKGKLVEEIIYTRHGSNYDKPMNRKYYYDANDRLILKEQYYPPGKKSRSETYTRDSNGRTVKYEVWDSSSRLNATDIVNRDYSGTEIDECSYDDKGNIVARTLTDKNGVIQKVEITYEYDAHGNIIKNIQKYSRNNEPFKYSLICIQEIEYY